jgi:hypothetical protein
MAGKYACHIAFAPDRGVPTPALLARLSSLERDLVMHLPTEQQRRQSTLARLAGKSAIERPLGRRASRSSRVEILKAANGEPVALVDGNAGVASVSLAHSSRLAVACAWTNLPRNGYGAGVDLERVRHSEVASSPYAFSRRERRLISAASQRKQRGRRCALKWNVVRKLSKYVSSICDRVAPRSDHAANSWLVSTKPRFGRASTSFRDQMVCTFLPSRKLCRVQGDEC